MVKSEEAAFVARPEVESSTEAFKASKLVVRVVKSEAAAFVARPEVESST